MKKFFRLLKFPRFLKQIGAKIKNNIQRSIRIQLFTTFLLCALGSFLVARAVVPFFENNNETVIVDYSGSMKMMYYHAQDTAALATQENSVEALNNGDTKTTLNSKVQKAIALWNAANSGNEIN